MRFGVEGIKGIGELAKVHVLLGHKHRVQWNMKGSERNRKGWTHWNNYDSINKSKYIAEVGKSQRLYAEVIGGQVSCFCPFMGLIKLSKMSK